MIRDNSSRKFSFVIPARMESSRFPGKPLKLLKGIPVIDWVYNNCYKSIYCDEVFIATDSTEIANHCKKTKKSFILTGAHNCASNRVSEASQKIDSDWIVEVQGDEPLLWAGLIDNWLSKCLEYFEIKNIDLFLSIAVLSHIEADNPNYVKIIKNKEGGLQWISRSRIPSNSKKDYKGKYFRHSGFHLWNKRSLASFAAVKPSLIEESEDTHASRIVENNFNAMTIELPDTQAIDMPEDIGKAENILEKIRKDYK